MGNWLSRLWRFGSGREETQEPAEKPQGFVYVVKGEHGLRAVRNSTSPSTRFEARRTALSVSISLEYIVAVDRTLAFQLEMATHALLAKYILAGEWFDCSPEIAAAAIDAAAQRLKISITPISTDQIDAAMRVIASL